MKKNNPFPYSDDNKRYHTFNYYLKHRFHDKVFKVPLNAGFTCPNRDGRCGVGGCTFCSALGSGDYAGNVQDDLMTQFEKGFEMMARKWPNGKAMAYFQAYTNTYAKVEELRRMYEEALSVDKIVGIIIGTRPDCVSDELLDYLEELNGKTFLLVEFGIESANDKTLQRINRGHTFACTQDAFARVANRGIRTGGHVILGLPGENHEELMRQTTLISDLPLVTLKLHQLQLIKGTRMAFDYKQNPEMFHLYGVDEYVDVVIDYVERLRPDIVLERFVSQSPKDLLIGPDWGIKNYEFTERLKLRLHERDTWQGKYYKEN